MRSTSRAHPVKFLTQGENMEIGGVYWAELDSQDNGLTRVVLKEIKPFSFIVCLDGSDLEVTTLESCGCAGIWNVFECQPNFIQLPF